MQRVYFSPAGAGARGRMRPSCTTMMATTGAQIVGVHSVPGVARVDGFASAALREQHQEESVLIGTLRTIEQPVAVSYTHLTLPTKRIV